MKHIVTAIFILVGIVNFLPVLGVLGAARLETLYGLPITQDDLLLLLRHRATLFGLLGAFIIASAFRDSWRNLAAAAGLLSMLSFILLALPLSAHGAELQRVFWIDVIACVLLAFGCWRHNR
jgi:hypothetical protein